MSSSGSDSRSAGRNTMISPRASLKPRLRASVRPRRRRWRTRRTRGSRAASAFTAAAVPSLEPSSTYTSSHGRPMSAKALAVFSTNAGTVPTSLLAGTTTETSGSLEPVIGAVPMCACSHHAKPGVTQTTPGADRTPKPLDNAGLQESDGRADTPLDRRSPWEFFPESGWKLYWRSTVEQVQPVQPVPRGRRLLARLCLFAFCGGLLLLLSSRPAEAAERRGAGAPGTGRPNLGGASKGG